MLFNLNLHATQGLNTSTFPKNGKKAVTLHKKNYTFEKKPGKLKPQSCTKIADEKEIYYCLVPRGFTFYEHLDGALDTPFLSCLIISYMLDNWKYMCVYVWWRCLKIQVNPFKSTRTCPRHISSKNELYFVCATTFSWIFSMFSIRVEVFQIIKRIINTILRIWRKEITCCKKRKYAVDMFFVRFAHTFIPHWWGSWSQRPWTLRGIRDKQLHSHLCITCCLTFICCLSKFDPSIDPTQTNLHSLFQQIIPFATWNFLKTCPWPV